MIYIGRLCLYSEFVNLEVSRVLVPPMKEEYSEYLKSQLLNVSFHDFSKGVTTKNARMKEYTNSYLLVSDISFSKCSLSIFFVTPSSHAVHVTFHSLLGCSMVSNRGIFYIKHREKALICWDFKHCYSISSNFGDNLKKGEDAFNLKVTKMEALQNTEIAPAFVIIGLDNDESLEEKWFPLEYNRKIDKLASYGAKKYCSWLAYSLVTVGQGLRYFYIGASTTGYSFEKRVSMVIRFSKGVQYGYTNYKSPASLVLLSEISLDEVVKYVCLVDAFFMTVGNKSVNSLFSACVAKAFLGASWTYTVAGYEMGSNSPSSDVLMMQSRMELLQQLTYLYYCSWHWYFCGCSILPATTDDMQPWFASIKQLLLLQYCIGIGISLNAQLYRPQQLHITEHFIQCLSWSTTAQMIQCS